MKKSWPFESASFILYLAEREGFYTILPSSVTRWYSSAVFGCFRLFRTRTGARQNVLKHCVWMTFVTQFNYFKKSIDSIFYSTPQIVEEIMALRHSLLTLNKSVAIVFCLSSHCLCIMFMNCPYERGIILHHDHYLTIIIQMPISQIWLWKLYLYVTSLIFRMLHNFYRHWNM